MKTDKLIKAPKSIFKNHSHDRINKTIEWYRLEDYGHNLYWNSELDILPNFNDFYWQICDLVRKKL